ncbi:MAG: hypothetical protein KDA93_27660 [Planctomycetaceae bacterium]|nr:hypothetical protein [Planctomycetaceae bacterium]
MFLSTIFAASLFSTSVMAEPPTIDTIVRVIEPQNRRIESLHVKYHLSSELVGSASDAKEYLGMSHLPNERMTFAVKGVKRYFRKTQIDDVVKAIAPNDDGTRSEVNVARDEERAFDGEVFWQRSIENQQLTISPASQVEHHSDLALFNQEYFQIQVRSLPDIFNPEEDRSTRRIPDLFATGTWSIESDSELVGDDRCVLVTNGDRRLWLAEDFAYAVRKSEEFFPDSRILGSRIVLSEFTEVAEDVWMPQRIVSERFPHPRKNPPNRIRGMPLVKDVYEVEEIHANDVPNSLFRYSTPPGTLVFDFTQEGDGEGLSLAYRVPADEADSEESVFNAVSKRASNETSGRSLAWNFFVIANVVLLLIVGAVWLLIRARR